MVNICKNKLLFFPSGQTEGFGCDLFILCFQSNSICGFWNIYGIYTVLFSLVTECSLGWRLLLFKTPECPFCVYHLHVLSLLLHSLFLLYVSSGWCLRSHLYAFHCLVDGLQQGLVLRVLVAVFIGVHVSQCTHIVFKILLCDWFLLWERKL